MFTQFQTLLQSPGLMKTVTNGDCFFDTMHKVTHLYTARQWRQNLSQSLLEKKVFTQKQYLQSMVEWADYPIVYEAIRHVNRPCCVVQHESPNAVMLIRPPKVPFTPTNLMYLVYDHGVHFTSFVNPITPPAWIERLYTMERAGMHEEEEGLTVTHGSLNDLVHNSLSHNSLAHENRVSFMRRYEAKHGIVPTKRTQKRGRTKRIRTRKRR